MVRRLPICFLFSAALFLSFFVNSVFAHKNELPLGEPKNGLQATISSGKAIYYENESIDLVLTLTNVIPEPKSGGIEIDPWEGCWFVKVFDDKWQLMPHTVNPIDTPIPFSNPDTLLAGQSRETKILGLALTTGLLGSIPEWRYEPLKPGSYRIGAEYTAQNFPNHPEVWAGRLWTKYIRIDILPEKLVTYGRQFMKLHPDLTTLKDMLPVEDSLKESLKKYFPDFRFFLAHFDTVNPEYRTVSAVMAEKIDGSGMDGCLALNYTEPPQDFLNLFTGHSAHTPQETLEIMRTIAILLANTLYNGTTGTMTENLLLGGHEGRIEILWDGKVYRNLRFIFDGQYRLQKLIIGHPGE